MCGFLNQVHLVEYIFTISLHLSFLKFCALTFKEKLGTLCEIKKKRYLLHPHKNYFVYPNLVISEGVAELIGH